MKIKVDITNDNEVSGFPQVTVLLPGPDQVFISARNGWPVSSDSLLLLADMFEDLAEGLRAVQAGEPMEIEPVAKAQVAEARTAFNPTPRLVQP